MPERFEQSDVSTGLVARAGLYLTVAVAVIFLGAYGFLHLLGTNASVTGPVPAAPEWGEPMPSGYRWLDREHQIISIPIDRAIDLTVERGLPTRSKP